MIFRDKYFVCFFNLWIFDYYWRNKEDVFCVVYGFNVWVGGIVILVEFCVVLDLVKLSYSLFIYSNKIFSCNNLIIGVKYIYIDFEISCMVW